MKLVCAFVVTLLAAQPAIAWELDSSDTKKSWHYVAFQADKTEAIELQFYCDNVYADDVQMLVFTGEDAQLGDDDFPDVEVKAIVDSRSIDDLHGYYDDVDGERVVVIDTREEDRVRDIVKLARNASSPLQIDYGGRSHRFAVGGIAEALDGFTAGCER